MSASRGALAALVIPWVAWMAAGTRVEAQVAGAMDVWPRDSTVELGGTKQFGAYVPINPNTIRWLVNDVVGGNATLGTISASGLYKPPPKAPTNNVLAIKAQSTAYPTSYADRKSTRLNSSH